MSELHDLSAVEQIAALRGGQVSSKELVAHYLGRIHAYGESLGAFTHVFADQALAAAEQADRSAPQGPLHGLPMVLKDLHPSAGLPTTMGSAALAGWIPAQDAPVVARLRQAGAVIMAKTNAAEFGPTCYTETPVGGDAVTPYAEGIAAGGSSGGSAAAVAAGLVPVAHASDGLGSIRSPASNCGLVGFKPSRGRVPPVSTAWDAFGVEGPVARTVADAALLLDAIGDSTPGDLWRGPRWLAGTHAAALSRPLRRLRIGRLVDAGSGAAVHPECMKAVALAAEALVAGGHEIRDLGLPLGLRMVDLADPLTHVVAARIEQAIDAVIPAGKHHQLMPFTRWLLNHGRGLSAQQLLHAQTALALAATAWRTMQADYDAILTPTTSAPPQPVGAFRLDDGAQSAAAMLAWSAFLPWANFGGLPAVSLPVHQTADGLPVGVQLIANRFQDEMLFGLSAQLESQFQWHLRHPPVWHRLANPYR